MKIFTSLYIFLVVSSVLGLTIPTKREEQETDFDKDYGHLPPNFPIKKECNDALEKLFNENKECIEESKNDNEEDFKKFCDTYNTEKCQKFINTKFIDIPECQSSIKQSIELLDEIIKIKYRKLKAVCATDEQGKYCPLSEIEIRKKINKTMTDQQQEEIYDDLLKDTCKSQKCKDVYISYYEFMENSRKELIEILPAKGSSNDKLDSDAGIKQGTNESILSEDPILNKTLTYLRSDNCTVKINSNAINGSAEAESDAVTSMTYSSALFIALALLLFSL